MTKGQGKTDFIDVKALRSSDPDYLRAMVEAIVQATLARLSQLEQRECNFQSV
jgi:hypothetical protein